MFIKRLMALIEQKGITKNKMLSDLNLGKNSFVNWDNRGTIPGGETLASIAEYFDVSVDYLLGNTDTKKPAVNADDELNEYLEELKNRSEMRMLFSLAKGATKKDVEAAVKIIEALRSQSGGDE